MKSPPLRATALISSLAAALCHSTAVIATTPFSVSDAKPDGGQNQASPKPELMLAQRYREGVDLQQYLISEKLDGVRGYWTGRQLLSRQGYPIHAPLWFTRGLPKTPLDTELWIGRGKFEAVSAAVRRYQPIDQEWRSIQLKLLDLPTSKQPFEQRIKQLQRLADQIDSDHVRTLRYQRVTNRQQLQALLNQQLASGAEGLMLNRADALYQVLRSDAILKLKPYSDDEAVVLAHLPGKGKYRGVLGSMLVQIPNGKKFKIGSGFNEQQRRQPPPIGATISFKYFGLTASGKPRFASFLRRYDDDAQEH